MSSPVVMPMVFGENPTQITCPYCGSAVMTRTNYQAGMLTWIVCGIICVVGIPIMPLCWLGCCLIPCCIPPLKDVKHSCPNCSRELGVKNRLG